MRTRRTRLLAATGLALAALALTACEDGTGARDEGASKPATTTTTTTPTQTQTQTQTPSAEKPSGGATAEPGTTPNSTSDSSDSSASTGGSTSDSSSDASRVLCNGSNTKVTAQPVSRPLNHMLITVKNTGSKTCDLTYFPVLRFDEMQWVPQGAEATQPQAVVTLAPGESGYAGVLLAAADGSGDGGTTGHKLTIAFQGTTPNSSGGASATPPLPAKGVYYDSSLTVTYWQQNMDDAINY
ncbi:DUF4232 domain-containing protein [Streptomyces sp. NPDC002928]|uniref:DUF4232 domain-containing protein n=1 Tax=Streptomyces sp. NPDC002928 TaxID=3154440 RepID=UPI0033AC1165